MRNTSVLCTIQVGCKSSHRHGHPSITMIRAIRIRHLSIWEQLTYGGNDVRARLPAAVSEIPHKREKALAEPIHLGSTPTALLPFHHPVHVNRQHPSRWPVRLPNRSAPFSAGAEPFKIHFRPTTDILCALQSPRTPPSTTAARRLTVTGAYPFLPPYPIPEASLFTTRPDCDTALERESEAGKLEWDTDVTSRTPWNLCSTLAMSLALFLNSLAHMNHHHEQPKGQH
jgi:hypothetical protein